MSGDLILLIEDNDDDVLMIKRALKKSKISNEFKRVTNGKEGLEYLRNSGEPNPEMILLDLNMEVMNGFDFLNERKNDKELSQIPTIVLTSSSRNEDIEKSYELGANSYVEKPLDPVNFIETIIKIEEYWLTISKKVQH